MSTLQLFPVLEINHCLPLLAPRQSFKSYSLCNRGVNLKIAAPEKFRVYFCEFFSILDVGACLVARVSEPETLFSVYQALNKVKLRSLRNLYVTHKIKHSDGLSMYLCTSVV